MTRTGKITNKRGRFALCIFSAVILSMLAAPPTRADTDSEIISGNFFAKALQDLNNGRVEERIRATIILGASRNAQYVRPLGRELLHNLDKDSPYLKNANDDPYIKSHIAIAMGQIGHHYGIPYLLKGLAKTSEIIDAELTGLAELRARENKFAEERNKGQQGGGDKKDGGAPDAQSINANALPKVVMDRTVPGPAHYRKAQPSPLSGDEREAHPFPYSPDVHWSQADDFKNFQVVRGDDYHQVRLYSYNYVNLSMHLLDAIGEVYISIDRNLVKIDAEEIKEVVKYLNHKIPAIRGAAALALGNAGTLQAMSALEERFAQEKGDEAGVIGTRVKICQAILQNDKTRTKYYKELLDALKHDNDYVRFDAAVAMRELKFGEALVDLRNALKVENRDQIQKILNEAIYNAEIDNMTPVPLVPGK